MSRYGIEERVPTLSMGRILALPIVAVVLLLLVLAPFKLVEHVNADEILVVQDMWDGELHWYTSPGVKPQWGGTVTRYPKRFIYEFEAPAQFNDGGKGVIHGSIQVDLPLDQQNLTELHTRYGSADAIKRQVVETVTNKVIYMTGPVMSSRESYAEKRNYLINYVQDQIDNGVYQTRQVQKEEVDQFTGQKKVVTAAEIVVGGDGRPARQERSVVAEFGIRAFNFAIEQIDYDDAVENQIKEQQRITMAVQTSVAEALKSQQQAITAEQNGKANAAQAKWEQEVIKAKAVTAAEQEREVARLRAEAAGHYKNEQLLRAEADATYKRRVMEADGALAQKLATYERTNQMWAEAFKNHQGQLVPNVMMGGANGSTNGMTTAQTFMEMLTLQAMRDLGLQMRPQPAHKVGGDQ